MSRSSTLVALATRLLRTNAAAVSSTRAVSTLPSAAAPPAVADRLSEEEGTGSSEHQPRWLRELGVIRNDWT